jgi:hypothetical protein
MVSDPAPVSMPVIRRPPSWLRQIADDVTGTLEFAPGDRNSVIETDEEKGSPKLADTQAMIFASISR